MTDLESSVSTSQDPLPLSDDQAQRGAGLSARPETAHRSVASDAATYTLAVFGSQALVFGAGIIQKALLGPTLLGFWSLIGSLSSMYSLSALGAFEGGSRQIPRERGRADYNAAAAVADTTCSLVILAITATSLVVAAVALLAGHGWAPELRYGLVFLVLTAPLAAVVNCHELVLQVTKRFQILAISQVLEGFVTITVQTLLVWTLGYWGLFVGAAIVAVASLVFWRSRGLTGRRTPAFHFRIVGRRARALIGVGIPIMIFTQFWLLFVSVDNFIVAGFIDVRSLGFYAVAVSVTGYVLLLPKSIDAVLHPLMQERFAPADDVAAIRELVLTAQNVLAMILIPVAVAAAFTLVPVLIRQALPAFDPAIPVVEIMVAATFFLALVTMPMEFLITAGYRWRAATLMLGSLGLNAGANFVAVAVLGAGIRGAALATTVSYLLFFISITGYATTKAIGGRAGVYHISRLLVVAAWVVGALWGSRALVPLPNDPSLVRDIAIGVSRFAVALALMSPCLALAERQYGVLRTLLHLVVKRMT